MTARRAVLLENGATGPRAREGSALATSLAARGFMLERLSQPRDALDSLASNPPDVLIVDADSPWLDLREFVETLRQDARTARTLIVALVSGDPRELPARREIALILAKPINADEAASRLEGLVITRQRAATNPRELRGDLGQLPLPDLLQLLSVSRASGTLQIDASGRRGMLVMDQGDLRELSYGPTTGLKAFVRLLLLGEGAFVFTHGAVAPGDKPVEVLALGPTLFEATRQLDEIARLRPGLPEAWVEIRRSRRPVPHGLSAQDAGSAVLAELEHLLDVPRTLGALLDASAFTDASLYAALEVFRREGLIDVAQGGGGARIEVVDATFAAALVARLDDGGRGLARVLVLVDPTPGAIEASIVRAFGGIAGFALAETPLTGALPLGTLGTLQVGGKRVELFAVPADRELFPLWAVFGAGAEAAVVASRASAADVERDERAISVEIGIPVASVQGALTARSLADALRAVLEQLDPRR